MNANAEHSTTERVDRDRRHQLILIETMVRNGVSGCQIVYAAAAEPRLDARGVSGR